MLFLAVKKCRRYNDFIRSSTGDEDPAIVYILRLYDNSFGVSLENLQESELSLLKIKSSTSRNETRKPCASKEAIY